MTDYQKTKKIKNIFNKVSSKYDFFNNLFSLGLHILWKKKLIKLLKPRNGEHWADLCCGTGDLALLLNNFVYPNGKVTAYDNASEILEIAKNKSRYLTNNVISWSNKDIFEIDNSLCKFEGIIMSYGLRNLNNVEDGLKKVFSLLKNKGKAGFLDFNHAPNNSISGIIQKLYLRIIVVPISSIFNLKCEYEYIEDSVNKFPSGYQLMEIARKIGFQKIKYITLTGGQMAILILEK